MPGMRQPEPAQESEPLMSVADVAGLKFPEPLYRIQAEKDLEEQQKSTPYEVWRADPSPDNLAVVTRSLKPTMDSVLASIGAAGNPQLTSRARVVTAKAVQAYNPNVGVSLPTWVSSQLRQLTRDVRKSNNVLSIPEGIQLDGYALYRAEQEFMDTHDREPTVEELADASHFSIKRIQAIRKKMKAVASDLATTAEDGSELAAGSTPDYSKDAIDYVYNDSDLTDKRLLEMLLGYGGTDILDNNTIMRKLKLTPVQLTRRKARLSLRIRDIIDNLEAL